MTRSRRTALTLVLITACLAAPTLATALTGPTTPATAAASAGVLLTADAPRAEWSGRTWDAAVYPPAPEACTSVTCEVFTLTLDVPSRGVYRETPGVLLEVGARWGLEQNDFELFLMDASGTTRLGASEGGFSVSETLMVPLPANGAYRVVLVPFTVTSPERPEFVAELQLPVHHPEGDLLPNLVTKPPFDLQLVAPVFYSTGTGLSVGDENGVVSCYPDETIDAGATRCLRFSNTISNIGRGDLEVRFDVTGMAEGLVDAESRVLLQRVYHTDGSHYDVRAGDYEIHATHGHLHYEGFAEYSVHAFDEATGEIGAVVAVGHKSGFCPEDVDQERWDEPDTRARRFSFPACNTPNEFTDDGRAWMVQGVTSGWGDTYTWDLPDQYVEISGVPDGVYVLVSTADPLGTLVEADVRDNTAVTVFRLTGDSVEELGGWRMTSA